MRFVVIVVTVLVFPLSMTGFSEEKKMLDGPFADRFWNQCCSLSADGKRLAMEGGQWAIWDIPSGKCLFSGQTKGAWAMTFSADSRYLAVGGNYNEFYLIDVVTGTTVWDLTKAGHVGVIRHIEFTPDGKFLVSMASDGMLRVWNLQDRAPEALYCFTSSNNNLNLWKEYLNGWKTKNPNGLPGGVKIFSICEGTISDLNQFAITRDGKCAALALGIRDVKFIDLFTGKCVKSFRTNQVHNMSLQFSEDGKWLAIGGGDIIPDTGKATIEIWDVEKGRLLTTLPGHKKGVLNLAISPDKKTIVSGGSNDGARVWDVETAQQKFAYHQTSKNGVVGVAFLPDGRTFLTLPHDAGHPVQFWDTANGKEVSPITQGKADRLR